MRRSISIGKIMGIDIQLHYSWFLIFALLTVSLSIGYMPQQYPGLAQSTYWIIGAAASVSLFISVLLHELSHSYVAMRKNIRIPRIVLFFFGGISQMANEAHKPSDEIKIALAGPFLSFGLAAILIGGWFLMQLSNLNFVELVAIVQYGGIINVLLGAFNLLPAFPMDGGRVLRAKLWQRSGDILDATSIAVKVSRYFAYALIFGSFALIFILRDFSALWLLVIGLFLRSAADSALVQTRLKYGLKDVTARDVAVPRESIDASASLQQLSEYSDGMPRDKIPVTSEGNIVGIIVTKDLKDIPETSWESRRVDELMKSVDDNMVVGPNTPALEVLSLMTKKGKTEAFVVEEDKFVGVVKYRNLIDYAYKRETIS